MYVVPPCYYAYQIGVELFISCVIALSLRVVKLVADVLRDSFCGRYTVDIRTVLPTLSYGSFSMSDSSVT